ncbi:MAG TPA: ABC transporter permease [Verrucomicrobiae bacterium]|nr:ABC transporter permease [Verrucomicrobiae bacterium]
MKSLRDTPAFWVETWSLAMQALLANKVRAALTMLGVVIGSACIVLVVTVGLAGRRYIIHQIEGVGANIVFADLVRSSNPGSTSLADEISLDDMEAVRRGVPHVRQVAGTNNIPVTVAVSGVEHPVNLVGVTDGFQQIRNLVIVEGRYFDPDDMATRNKVCLLTQDLARLVFPGQDPVNQDIRVGELHFTVIGVFRERISTFGQSEITRDSILIPFSLIKDYTGESYIETFYAQADKPDDVAAVTRGVAEMLQSRHRPGAEYQVENLTGILDTARSISTALTITLILIALIALIISGIGIMNIMLVTVTERTREIGIRKAIGAPRDAIRYQFLMEAFVISATGALAGIGIATFIPALIDYVASYFPEVGTVDIPISWLSVLVAFVVSSSTGLLFGYLPANRAAQMNPTEALRYE